MKLISVKSVNGRRLKFKTKFDAVNLYGVNSIDEAGVAFKYDLEPEIHKIPINAADNDDGEYSIVCIATVGNNDISVIADYYIREENYTDILEYPDVEKFLLKQEFDSPCLRFNIQLSQEEKIQLLCAIYKKLETI